MATETEYKSSIDHPKSPTTGRRWYSSMAEIRTENTRIGHFFFEPWAMRFFNSKVASRYPIDGHLFITSEQFVSSDGYHAPRKYTLRDCLDDGRIETVGEFQQYASLREATKAARELAKFSRQLP